MTGERKSSMSESRPDVTESPVISIHASPENMQGIDGKGPGVDGKSPVGYQSFLSQLQRGIEHRDCESFML
jgi:hypothetical protein